MSTYTSREEAVEDVSKRGHDILTSKFGIKGYRNDNLLDKINHTITFTSFENNVIGLNWFCEDIHTGDYVLIGDVFSGGKVAKIKERLPTKDSKILKFWYEETVIKYENIEYEGFGDLGETIDRYYSELNNANKPEKKEKKKEKKKKKIITKYKAMVVPILTMLYMTYIVFANVYYHYYLYNLSNRAENAFNEYKMNQYKYESMNTHYMRFKKMEIELTEKFNILDILVPKLITDENVLTQDQCDFLNHKYEKLIEKYNNEKLNKIKK